MCMRYFTSHHMTLFMCLFTLLTAGVGCKLDDNRLRGRVFIGNQPPPPNEPPSFAAPPEGVQLGNSSFTLHESPWIFWDEDPLSLTTELRLHRASDHVAITDWIEATSPFRFSSLNLSRGEQYYVSLRSLQGDDSYTETVLSPAWMAQLEVPCADGDIEALLVIEDKVYLGGGFSALGPCSGGGIFLNPSNGELQSPLVTQPRVAGSIDVSIPDGEGGVYIGGLFSAVQGLARRSLAHIDRHGNVTSWNPEIVGSVRALALHQGTLYVGGSFISIDSQTRTRLAAFDLASGNLTPWNPAVNNTVNSLSIKESSLYVGGMFSEVEGETRGLLASFDLSTDVLPSWSSQFIPHGIGTVRSFSHLEQGLYVGGSFTIFGGEARSRLASMDLNTGELSSWNPGASGTVRAMTHHQGTLYIGGSFNTVEGVPRGRVAAFDLSDGGLTDWAPSIQTAVHSLATDGTDLFVGGVFTWIDTGTAFTRNRLASFNLATGELTPWNPNMNSLVSALETDGVHLYAGGAFTSASGQTRNRLAAFNLSDGSLVPSWSPSFTSDIEMNTHISALKIASNRLYVGGYFNYVDGEPRNYLAAFELSNGLLHDWHANLNSRVRALAQDEKFIYAGGDFISADGVSRHRLAAFSISGHSLSPWKPNIGGSVYTLFHDGGGIWAGGGFSMSQIEEQGPLAGGICTLGPADP